MKKTIRLTETELSQLIKRMIQEVDETQYEEPSAELYASLAKNVDQDEDEDSMEQQIAEYWARKRRKNRISEQLISATDRDSKSRQICYKYKVQNGDNMWDIASKMREKFAPNQPMNDYWYDWKANMVEFNIVDLNKIKTGDIIPIPMSCGKMNK